MKEPTITTLHPAKTVSLISVCLSLQFLPFTDKPSFLHATSKGCSPVCIDSSLGSESNTYEPRHEISNNLAF